MTARVIGNWKPLLGGPGAAHREALGDKFLRKLRSLGLDPHRNPEVRDPVLTTMIGNTHGDIAFRFHEDGHDPRYSMVMWSNVQPTEVLLADGTVLPAKDGDIILMDSPRVMHRGQYPVAPDRWFIRVQVRELEQ